MISVITVTKNDSVRLASTVKSLTKYYKLKNFQHIVVHGGEVNYDEKKLIKHHKKIELINENDNGIYDAMNKGINRCKMDYVLFLNCGDRLVMTPKNMKIVLDKLKVCNIICLPYIQEWPNQLIKKNPTSPTKNILPTSHQAMLFRKTFIKKNLYDTTYKIAADFDLYHKSNFSQIQIVKNCNPLTLVEGEGVASSNITRSYMEYFIIVKKKFGIFFGAIPLFKILFKYFLSFISNTVFSKRIANKIREFICKISRFYD